MIGIWNKKLKERLLEDPALILDITIRICQAKEVTKSRMKLMECEQFSDTADMREDPKHHKKRELRQKVM